MASTALWDPVPWMTGGGAQHSTNLGRSVAYGAFGAQEGIVNALDCEVRELASPGAGVRIYSGTVAIQNRATGAFGEMYVGRLPAPGGAERVDIAATTAGGGRSDLIVARVENPFEEPGKWAIPSDKKVGPYIFTRVISNVPASTVSAKQLGLGQSMIALARIDIPASKSVITQAMIKDLRKMSAVKSKREMAVVAPTTRETLSSGSYANWPTTLNQTVDVPDWATRVNVRAIMAGLSYGQIAGTTGGLYNVFGGLRIQIGADTASPIFSEATAYNLQTTAGHDTATLMCAAPKLALPARFRGVTTQLRTEGFRYSNSVGELFSYDQSMLTIECEFYEEPASNA